LLSDEDPEPRFFSEGGVVITQEEFDDDDDPSVFDEYSLARVGIKYGLCSD
jgi:hypothetical protein